jgi:hypothetical protein
MFAAVAAPVIVAALSVSALAFYRRRHPTAAIATPVDLSTQTTA